MRASFGRFGDNVAITASEDDLVDWALDDLETITGFDGRAAGLEEIYVQRWLGRYVTGNPDASFATKARYPLSQGRVTVSEIPGRPGSFTSVTSLT